MVPELTQDIFHVVLIDQEVPLHDLIRGAAVFQGADEVMLVPECGLRIGHEAGGDERMGMAAFPAQDALYSERQEC